MSSNQPAKTLSLPGPVYPPADSPAFSRMVRGHQDALNRCVARLADLMPVIGLRNPKIGNPDFTWQYCGPFDWVVGFHSGQLWLAYQLTGDQRFANAAKARRETFRRIIAAKAALDHDAGFQYSLSCVAEWLMTGNAEARDMALKAADFLVTRFNPSGNYIQAWNPRAGGFTAAFANGRVIADSMMNLGILHWAHRETGRRDYFEIAEKHAETVLGSIVRPDWTSYHCYRFDPVSGDPLGGDTLQGFAPESCWARGQSWLVFGFAHCYQCTGNGKWLDAARNLAARTEEMVGDSEIVVWDYRLPAAETPHPDSSAAAITAAGVYLLASLCEQEEAARWRAFGDRLLAGLLRHSDITADKKAMGMLDHGASHVARGLVRAMLPYGDYFFMEALMRSQGHDSFFW